MHYDREGTGSQDDVESVAGNGTVIAILKNVRTRLATIAASVAVLGSLTFIGTRLATDTVTATATAAAPTYTEGTDVKLSTDLAGNLRTSGGGGGGGNPTGGWLDSVRFARDSITGLRANMTHIGRVAIDSLFDSVMAIASGRLDSVRRIDTLRFGRVADSLFSWLGSTAPTVGQKTMANSLPVVVASDQTRITVKIDTSAFSPSVTSGNVSIGTSTNKTLVMKTGSLTTTATTADQVVLTYTVTSGKTFYLEYVNFTARLTTLSTTGSIMGLISLETPSGTKGITNTLTNPTNEIPESYTYTFPEPLPIAATVVIRCVTTPAATTSMLWQCNFGGYEK